MTFKTPILLIAWRRPRETKKVIESLKVHKPVNIFIACDGPIKNNAEEEIKVIKTRNTISENIDWECKIETFYSDSNLGCKIGVSKAITWFFENVEEGIILDDDCIPHPDFFNFCSELLERYRDDERVWCISGNNVQGGKWRGNDSYFFGKIPLIWGWASWSRCWKSYDVNINKWPLLKDSNLLNTVFDDVLEKRYWSDIWEKLYKEGVPNTWDYQWCFTCISNSGLTAFPNRNLISNIGFGKDAAHTTWEMEPESIEVGIGDISHPKFIIRDVLADRYAFDYKFGGISMRRKWKFIKRLSKYFKRFL